MISTSIKLDGEAEFKKQLSAVNSNLKNLNSDIKLVTEEFKGQANSLEALTAKDKLLNEQVDQQKEKVQALERALTEAADAYGESDKRTDEYRRSLTNAKAELIKLEREVDQNSRYLDEARRSADKTAKSIDGFGKEVKDADGDSKDFVGSLKDLAGNLGNFKKLVAGGAVVTILKETAGAINQIVDSTADYRRVMGTLDSSSQAAGYTAEETEEAYTRLYGVLADNQATATTVANLQSIGLEQDKLMELVDLTTGAWAKYGDSIPIDGLAESINETIHAGQVTGTFADVLNWTAGITEDEFNVALANCKTATERADLVMQTMAGQGLAEIAEGYRTAESETIKANEAQAKYEEAQANLAEKLLPAKTALTNLATAGWDVLSSSIQGAIDLFHDAMDLFNGNEKHLEAYTTADGQTRYRLVEEQAASVTQGLTGAELRERGVTSADVYNAAATVANSSADIWSRGSRGSTEMVHTTINIDGRAVAEVTAPAMREYNKSNPEVVSDKL